MDEEKPKHKEIVLDEGFPGPALVLTRYVGEGARITMGDIEVEAVVVKVKGKQVRLAIKAPKEYGQIDRIRYQKMRK